MSGLSEFNTELIYEYARESFRSEIETGAHRRALEKWQTNRLRNYSKLDESHEDSHSTFEWNNIQFERHSTGPDENEVERVLVTGVERFNEPEIADLASDFARDYLDAIHSEIQSIQVATTYSPHEFVVFVLEAAEDCSEHHASRLMDVSLGSYRAKKGNAADKLRRAEDTIALTERIRR